MGNQIVTNFCEYVAKATDDTDKRVAKAYNDYKAKIPASITGDKLTQVLNTFSSYTKSVHLDMGEINNVECPFIRERKARIARMTDFNVMKDKLLRLNTNISERCQNWDKIFAATLKVHTDYLPEIIVNPKNQRFGVIDCDVKGLDTFYAGLASSGKSPMEKYNDGWKQVLKQTQAKNKELQAKIEAEGALAKERVNAIANIEPDKKTACLDEIKKTLKDSKNLLDNEYKTVETYSKDSLKEVTEDLSKNPVAYDPSALVEPREDFTVFAVNERAIAASALHILYTNCKDATK